MRGIYRFEHDHLVEIYFDEKQGKVLAKLDDGKGEAEISPLGERVAYFHHSNPPCPTQICRFFQESTGKAYLELFGAPHIKEKI